MWPYVLGIDTSDDDYTFESFDHFIVQLPACLGYKNLGLVHDAVYRGLYYSATNDSEYLPKLYPGISEEEIAMLQKYHFISPFDRWGGDAFFEEDSYAQTHGGGQSGSGAGAPRYFHQKGHTCGRSFEKGEPVYQCAQCGYDTTCVLCVECYNLEDHQGHDVRMYFSTGSNSGICDCGDAEAFTQPLHCRTQMLMLDENQQDNDLIGQYPEWQEALKRTMRIALDYYVDVLNGSVQKLPLVKSFSDDIHQLYPKVISDNSSLSPEKYGGAIDRNSDQLWYLVLWNDEHHDYTQATSAIKAASNRDTEDAKHLAHVIDQVGYAVVNESTSYRTLLETQPRQAHGGLIFTIVSARDFMRQQICKDILEWIYEATHHANASFSSYAKRCLAELLLEPGIRLKSTLDNTTFSVNVERKKCFRNGMLIDDKFENVALTSAKVREDFDLDLFDKYTLSTRPELDKLQYSRLQYFLAFQVRMCKLLRKRMNKTFIPVLISDPESKQVFCNQFVEIYPLVLATMAYADVEEELNMAPDILVQVFTCPKSVLSIYRNNTVGCVVGPVIEIIQVWSSRWSFALEHSIFVDKRPSMGLPQKEKPIEKAISTGLQAVGYLVDKQLDISTSEVFFEERNLVLFLSLIRFFQEYWPLVKKWGDHVEREVFDQSIHSYYSLRILRIVQKLVESKTSNMDLVRNAVQFLLQVLRKRPIKYSAPGIADFKVSRESVSLIHPVHSMLSFIIEYYGFDNFSDLLHDFLPVYDISLRSIVLMSQIKSSFWIRNGVSVSYHADAYVSFLKDLAYLRDIHICQVALLVENPVVAFLNILDRWELLEWYVNKVLYLETTYEDKFFYVVDKLIHFFYTLLVNRDSFKRFTPEERHAYISKRMMLYTLAGDPQPFSKLKRIIPLDDDVDIESALEEYGEYHEPTGLTDSGKYLLKTKYLKELDPMSVYLDCTRHNDFDSISEALSKHYASKQGIAPDKVILPPRLESIPDAHINGQLGAFAKTKEFAKFVHKLLQLAINASNELYLPTLLHLIHAILVDDENLHGKQYLCESYVDIPICDLLLIIVESSMSRKVVEKADFLVGMLMKKSEAVVDSLVDCFGENHIVEYKKRKLASLETNEQKRKRIAEQKKAKIMKSFAQQRQQFLDKNKDYLASHGENNQDEDDNDNDNDNDGHHCVYCGEPNSTDAAFGLMATISNANIFWKVPVDNNDRMKLAFNDFNDQHDIVKEGQLFGIGYDYQNTTPSYLDNKNTKGEVISTCGHGLHYKCYMDHFNRSSYIVCPLCSCLHNFFIPTFVPPPCGASMTEDELTYAPLLPRYNRIIESHSARRTAKIMYNMLHGKYATFYSRSMLKSYLSFSHMFFKKNTFHPCVSGNTGKDKAFNNLVNLTLTLANTVRMAEIATRLEEEESLYSFLELIPIPTKTLIKSLIQFRAFAAEKVYEDQTAGGILGQIQEFWDFFMENTQLDGVFNEVIVLFFQTEESWHTLKLVGYIKSLSIIMTALLRRFSEYPEQYELVCGNDKNIVLDEETTSSMARLIDVIFAADYNEGVEVPAVVGQKAEFMPKFYGAVERLMLPLLRQYVVFEDSLTTVYHGGTEHERVEPFASLKDKLSGYDRLDSSDGLTDVLKLPSLQQLFSVIANEYDANFESKIFKVVVEAKLAKYQKSGILTLEYPGVIRLADIPKDYSKWINMYSDNWDYHVNNARRETASYICLHCGSKMKQKELMKHAVKCVVPCVLFYPPLNTLFIDVRQLMGPLSECYAIPAPYLTKHGEVKSNSESDKAFLNEYRYKNLSKLWINQGLYALVSRGLFLLRGSNQVPVDLADDMSDTWDPSDDNDDMDIDPTDFFRP